MMLHLELKLPSGYSLKLDTPDSQLVGDWLKSIFTEYSINTKASPVPLQFTLIASSDR
jgi:hypothetical protein